LVKKKCFKPILNTNKAALNRLKFLLCCCTFTLDHWACALCSYIAILQCKLRNYRNLDFLLFSRVISSGIIVVYLTSSCVNCCFFLFCFKTHGLKTCLKRVLNSFKQTCVFYTTCLKHCFKL
jgi:hypothetical protein